MLMPVCTWENVIAQLKNRALKLKLSEVWNMVLTRLSFSYFLVNRRKKFYGARIDQKIEYGFRFKKDSI